MRGQLVLVCLILNRGRGGAVGCTLLAAFWGYHLWLPFVFAFSRAVFSAREHLCISELLISLCFGCDAFTYFSPWFQPPIAFGVGGTICAWG